MGNKMLEVKNLKGYYEQSQILFGINLEVEEGDSVCILGRNGVGKSTTIKGIVGQLNKKNNSNADGSVKYKGKELIDMPSFKIARLGIAYVPQGRRIFSKLTTEENLVIAERPGVDGKNIWNLKQIYETFPRLKERKNSKGNSLSGGEQQMLTIARGLMQNPKLLVLDEPTEGLAPTIVKDVKRILKKLQDSGVTILLAEQSVEFAIEFSEKVYIIEKGEVVYKGVSSEVPDDVLKKYIGT